LNVAAFVHFDDDLWAVPREIDDIRRQTRAHFTLLKITNKDCNVVLAEVEEEDRGKSSSNDRAKNKDGLW